MNGRLRILWLKTGPLHPVDTGGKIRTYNMLRALKERHQITYLTLDSPATPASVRTAASEYSHEQIWAPWRETPKMSAPFFIELASNLLFSRLPYIIQKYHSRGMIDAIRAADQSGRHNLIICDFLTPAVNLLADGWHPKTPTLLFQHNVESLIWKRTFDHAVGTIKRAYFYRQWKRLETFERAACAAMDCVVAVSEEDCHVFRGEFGLKNVAGSVPTGVDVDFFRPAGGERQPHSIAFLGSMDWMPNIDAVTYFMEEIYLRLKAGYPDLKFTVIGRNPPPKIQALGRQHAGISVTGTVPDVRPHLARSEVMIVPLRVGGGTRIKIFEAMATGIPVVSTSVGAEGLPVRDGEHILLADSPADFADRVGRLLADPELRQRIGLSARALVEERHSWKSVNSVFENHCLRLAGSGGTA